MRSIYDQNNILEEESRLHFSKVCNTLNWKFRSYGQDNDIDGEIEIFDKFTELGETKNITSAQFVKIQLKASYSFDIRDDVLKFDAPVKFLNFVDICDQPVVLVLYDGNNKNEYWIWVQEYIFRVLDVDNPNWRRNVGSVRLNIPTKNKVDNVHDFQENVKSIAKNGIKEIQALRKKGYLNEYYTELKLEDFSNALQRKISVKIHVDKAISESREVMKELLVKLNNEYKNNRYFRNKSLQELHKKKSEADLLYMFFYNDLRQESDGLPFCRTIFKSNQYKDDINEGIPNEIIDTIRVYWYENEFLKDIYVNHRMTKSDYIENLDDHIEKSSIIATSINKSLQEYQNKKKSEIELIETISGLSKEVWNINSSYSEGNLPPYDCKKVHQKMNNVLGSLLNILIFCTDEQRDINNKMWGINFYWDSYLKDLNEMKLAYEALG